MVMYYVRLIDVASIQSVRYYSEHGSRNSTYYQYSY